MTERGAILRCSVATYKVGDALSRFCQEVKGTEIHMLNHCEGLAKMRLLQIGRENQAAKSTLGKLRLDYGAESKEEG